MPFAPTKNNRVAPRKRTLTSAVPTVKDGMARRRNPVAPAATSRVTARPNAATPLSTPSVKTGRVATGNTVKRTGVGKTIVPKLLARPLKTRITKRKSR